MNLHHDTQLFSQTLRAASQHLKINLGFVEKDYWITLLLRRLSSTAMRRFSKNQPDNNYQADSFHLLIAYYLYKSHIVVKNADKLSMSLNSFISALSAFRILFLIRLC